MVLDTRPHALRRVLVNLVDNALKFAGSAQLEVGSTANGEVSIKVLDNGPGIAEDELVQVMQKPGFIRHTESMPSQASQLPQGSAYS